MSWKTCRISRFIRKCFYESSSETRWITLLKWPEALQGDEILQHEFGIKGRVAFYDRANKAQTSLENSLEQMHLGKRLRDHKTPAAGEVEGKWDGKKQRAVRRGLTQEGDAIAVSISSVFML